MGLVSTYSMSNYQEYTSYQDDTSTLGGSPLTPEPPSPVHLNFSYGPDSLRPGVLLNPKKAIFQEQDRKIRLPQIYEKLNAKVEKAKIDALTNPNLILPKVDATNLGM